MAREPRGGRLPRRDGYSNRRLVVGLWLATNFLGNLSAMFGGGTAEPLEGAVYVDLLSSLLNVALCLVLIRLIRRLSRAQVMASEGSVFA